MMVHRQRAVTLLFYSLMISELSKRSKEANRLESDILSSMTTSFHKSMIFVNDFGMTLSSQQLFLIPSNLVHPSPETLDACTCPRYYTIRVFQSGVSYNVVDALSE
jgi:hypothetical protein